MHYQGSRIERESAMEPLPSHLWMATGARGGGVVHCWWCHLRSAILYWGSLVACCRHYDTKYLFQNVNLHSMICKFCFYNYGLIGLYHARFLWNLINQCSLSSKLRCFVIKSDRLYRFSQPIKDSHQWAPPACSLRHHRAPALTVWQRATLRQSELTRCQHPSGVHHIRDPGAGAAVSIVYKIWWVPLGPVSFVGCLLLVLLFCALWTLYCMICNIRFF